MNLQDYNKASDRLQAFSRIARAEINKSNMHGANGCFKPLKFTALNIVVRNGEVICYKDSARDRKAEEMMNNYFNSRNK